MTDPQAAPPRVSRAAWLALAAALLGWAFDGVEMGLFPLAAGPALGELRPGDQSQGMWMSVFYAAFLLGAAAGGGIFGWLGDRYGRVRAMTWSVLVYSVFSGACGLVGEAWQLAALRFVSSLGMGGEWALGVALVMEVWPARYRPVLAGLIGAAANVGFLLVAWAGLQVAALADGLRVLGLPEAWVATLAAHSGWRLLMVLGAAPALLTFFLRMFVPESQAWKQAANRAAPPRLAEAFAPGLRRSTLLATALATVVLLGAWGSVQWLPKLADTLAGRIDGTRSYTQMMLAAGIIIGAFCAPLAAQVFNRRVVYAVMCLLSLIACAVVFRTTQVWGGAFLIGVFAIGLTTGSFYGWLPLYLPELFPTRLRATAQGFAYNAGRVLTTIGVLAGGQLVDAFGGDYARMCAITSLVFAVGLAVIPFCPETKGRELPE